MLHTVGGVFGGAARGSQADALAVMFWQMGSMAKAGAVRVRPLAMTFAVGYAATAVVAWRYFFAAPAVVELVIAGCLAGAFVAAGRGRRGASAEGV